MSCGIGPVQQNHLLACLSAAVHEFQHTDIIGIEAQSYILNIYHQNIKFLHDGVRGPRAATIIERTYGDTRGFINRTLHMLSCIGSTTEAVFRTKQGGYQNALGEQSVQSVHALTVYSCLVAEEGNPVSAEDGQIKTVTLASQQERGIGMLKMHFGRKSCWHPCRHKKQKQV